MLTDKQKERWINEVLIMNKLKHPNIINTKELPKQFENYNVDNDLPILCMEYCTKGDLRSVSYFYLHKITSLSIIIILFFISRC